MDILASLNAQQRIAVEHGCGPALVLAGAGSGKTRIIAYRIAYLIRNGAARPENILAVTFTNKAAKEMRDRVHSLLEATRSAEPLITTFHSFCVRVLRREIERLGYKRDFSIYDTDDQRRLMKQILEDERRPEKDLAPREILSRISYAKNHNVPPAVFAQRFPSAAAQDIEHLYRVYEERLRKANALDFDDLLLKAVEILEKFPQVCDYLSDLYRYILVDEYQDTNIIQYSLLRLLTSKHTNILVVGDEDQSIYKFRGANIANILNFERDFPGTKLFKLEQNYRSTQTILDVAGAVVARNSQRKGKVLWTENSRGDTVTCCKCPSARAEAEWVAGRIRDYMEENPDSHTAVLYRTNALSRNFEDVLIERGIPYVVVGNVSFFSRMEVKDMLAYLRVVYNPEDDIALLRIINTPPRGIGSAAVEYLTQAALERSVPIFMALREICQQPQRTSRAHHALARFYELLDTWITKSANTPPGQLLQVILEQIHYREMLEKQETLQEAKDRIANVDELVRAAFESEDRGETIFEFLDRASLSSELDHFDPDARVALLTVHSAKGLEFDVVFLAGLEEGLFPHFQSRDSQEDLEEERRLCYVGMTRARRKLYLTWTPFRRSYGPDAGTSLLPSRFLHEVPSHLVEGIEKETAYVFEQDSGFRRQAGQENEFDADTRHDRENDFGYPRSLAELRAYVEKQNSISRRAPGPAGPVMKPGMRVRHAQFGDGIILSRERLGDDAKLTITFSRVGKKTLMERYAKLQSL